jgi:hypothetical protein
MPQPLKIVWRREIPESTRVSIRISAEILSGLLGPLNPLFGGDRIAVDAKCVQELVSGRIGGQQRCQDGGPS